MIVIPGSGSVKANTKNGMICECIHKFYYYTEIYFNDMENISERVRKGAIY